MGNCKMTRTIQHKIQKYIDAARTASTVVDCFNLINQNEVENQESHIEEDCDYIIAGEIYDIHSFSTKQECSTKSKLWQDPKETVCQETVETKDQSAKATIATQGESLSNSKKAEQVYENVKNTPEFVDSKAKNNSNWKKSKNWVKSDFKAKNFEKSKEAKESLASKNQSRNPTYATNNKVSNKQHKQNKWNQK